MIKLGLAVLIEEGHGHLYDASKEILDILETSCLFHMPRVSMVPKSSTRAWGVLLKWSRYARIYEISK